MGVGCCLLFVLVVVNEGIYFEWARDSKDYHAVEKDGVKFEWARETKAERETFIFPCPHGSKCRNDT